MVRTITCLSVLIMSIYAVGSLSQDLSQWQYAMNCTLKTASVGVRTDLVNFPVLIRLNNTNFGAGFSQVASGGRDIRFSKSDLNSLLSFEIARFDSVGKAVEIWVKVDTLKGNNNTQYITMRWGNLNAPNVSDGKAVFGSANGFGAVWHMEAASGSVYNDASSNGFHATSYGGITSTSGQIGNALNFDGVDDYLDPNANVLTLQSYTKSAWVWLSRADTFPNILSGFSGLDSTSHAFWAPKGGFLAAGQNSGYERVRDSTRLVLNRWYYVAVTYDVVSGQMILYKDSMAIDTAFSIPNHNYRNVTIGMFRRDMKTFWCGKIDEARVCNTVRSADWLKLCYKNQDPTTESAFIKYSQPYRTRIDTFPPNISAKFLVNSFVFSPTQIKVVWQAPESDSADAAQVALYYKDTLLTSSVDKKYPTASMKLWKRLTVKKSSEVVSETVTGLKPSQQYSFVLQVIDVSGNTSECVVASAHTYSQDNPITLKGEYLDKRRVKMTIGNFGSDELQYALRIGIWYQPENCLGKPDTSLKTKFLFDRGRMGNGPTFVCTLTVDTIVPPDSVYAFNAAVWWPDNYITPFNTMNCEKVLMRDKRVPLNPLQLSGQYLGGDSAKVIITGLKLIDTTDINSVRLKAILDGSAVISDTSLGANVMARLPSGEYVWNLKSGLFEGATHELSCEAVLVAIRSGGFRIESEPVKITFGVGREPISNPIVLKARTISQTQIELSWHPLDSVRIFVSSAPLPAQIYSTTGYRIVNPSRTDSIIVVGQLSANTLYYFGIQRYAEQQWSQIPESARAKEKTLPVVDSTAVENTVVLLHSLFDSITNEIEIAWKVTQIDTLNLEVGITFSLIKLPVDQLLQPQPPSDEVVQVTKGEDKIKITLGEKLLADTVYYVYLWLRNANGVWARPTTLSSGTVRIGKLTRQAIEYFWVNPPTDTLDSVYAFNGRVVLWNIAGKWPKGALLKDTLKLFTPPQTNGFIPISIGFSFSQAARASPFNIGIRYQLGLASGHDVTKARIYRWDDSLASWHVERTTKADLQKGILYVETAIIDKPFIIMIDTVKPQVVFANNLDDSIVGGKQTDIFTITDNIASVKWSYYCGRGSEQANLWIDSATKSNSQTFVVELDRRFINRDNGVRARLDVDDGVYFLSRDISRRVVRENMDVETMPMAYEKEWTPLTVHAILDKPDIPSILPMFTNKEAVWEYNPIKFRLFRWVPYYGNVSAPNGERWVEYSDSTKMFFNVTPGYVIWLKTKELVTVTYGRATTLDLKKPYIINLFPNDFTDISLPFLFDVYIEDIIAATVGANPDLDTFNVKQMLQIYEFYRDEKEKTYFTDKIYAPRFGHEVPSTALKSTNIYSVYLFDNSRKIQSFKLAIPPLPTSIPHTPGLLKASRSNSGKWMGWNVRIAADKVSGGKLNRIYCGYSPSEPDPYGIPMAPGFSNVRVGIRDEKNNRFYGAYMTNNISSGGVKYEIVFLNKSPEKQRLSYTLTTEGSFPQDMKAEIFNPANSSYEEQDTLYIDLEPNQHQSRWLVVGTEQFLQNIKTGYTNFPFALEAVYPCHGQLVKLVYTIPYGLNIKDISFTLTDIQGRLLWKHFESNSKPGKNELIWNIASIKPQERMSSGVYFIRMKATIVGQKKPAVFRRKFAYLPM